MGGNRTAMEEEAWLRRKLTKLWQRGHSEYCEVRDSKIHGSGVYAAKPISKGTRVIEYIGELISKKEADRRAHRQMARAEQNGDAAVYIFTLNKRWDIDGSVPWNTARLINHSCEPNCEAWVEGRRIFLYALRDIEKGEELTFDYTMTDDEPDIEMPCACGSADCRCLVTGRDWQCTDLQERYRGYFSTYLQRKIDAF